MAICQICGDRGYPKLLTHCVQCQNVAAHRYCVLGPPVFEDEDFNWSCEFCEPDQTESTAPSSYSEGLSSTVEQVALQKTAQGKCQNNLSPPQSERLNVAPEELVQGDADSSILHEKDKDGSLTRKKVKLTENGSPVLPHVSDATEVMPVTDVDKGDKSYNNVNTAEAMASIRKSEGLRSIVDQVVLGLSQLLAGKKCRDNLSPRLSVNSNVKLKKTVKGDTDMSILLQKIKSGSVKRKKLKLKKDGSPVLPHKTDATEVMPVTAIEQGDKSCNNFNKAEATATSGNSECLSSTVDQVVQGLTARKKCLSNLSPLQSEKSIVALKEIVTEDTDLSILYQKNKGGSARRKKVKLIENGSPVLSHVSDATEVVPVTDIGKGDKSCNDVTKAELVVPRRNSEGLRSTVDQVVLGLTARRKYQNNLFSPQSETPNVAFKESGKGATDMSILHQKDRDGSVKKKKGKLKENESPVLPHVSDADEVVPVTDIGKGDKSHSNVNKCKQELLPGGKHPAQLKRSVDANNISDNGVKMASSEDVYVTQPKIKKVTSSDTTGHRQVKLRKNVGPLLSKMGDHVGEITCTAGAGTQGDLKLLKQKKFKGCSLPKKENDINKSTIHDDERGYGATSRDNSSKVYSGRSEELHINENQHRDADLADNRRNNFFGVDVKSNRDVYELEAPRKKRKLIIEIEYSDEEPVFIIAKHPHRVADVGKDPSKSSSESNSKLRVNGLSWFSSVESVPPQTSPVQVDDRALTRESSVVFDNHIPGQPSPLMLVNYVPVQPLIDVAWRGSCSVIDDVEYLMSLTLEAHLSNKAHEKVHGAVSVLPELLNFDLVPKKYAWPRAYEESPPTADGIGLYLFPVDERAEKLYDSVVNKMVMHDLALKSVINNLELLVFCSTELPREEWSFLRKYYLWGVFKRRQVPFMPDNPSNIHTNHVQLPRENFYQQYDPSSPMDQVYCLPIMSNDPANTHIGRVLYDPSCQTTSFSNTHFRKEAVGPSVESPRSISNPYDRAYDTEERSFRQNQKPYRDRDDYREDCNRDSRKYRKFQDREQS